MSVEEISNLDQVTLFVQTEGQQMEQVHKISLCQDREDQKKNVEGTSSHRDAHAELVSFSRDYCKSFLGPSSAQSGVYWSREEVGRPPYEA